MTSSTLVTCMVLFCTVETVTPTVVAIKEEEEVQLTKPASPLVGDSSGKSYYTELSWETKH